MNWVASVNGDVVVITGEAGVTIGMLNSPIAVLSSESVTWIVSTSANVFDQAHERREDASTRPR